MTAGTTQATRVAVLGTLAEFHREPIPYDLASLVDLVTELRPDLLCLDLTPEQWSRQEFSGLPPEYREALLPLAFQTDIVVVPIGGETTPVEPRAHGRRAKLLERLRQALAFVQRTAPGPEAANYGIRHELANVLYRMIARLPGKEAFRKRDAHVAHLTCQVLKVARRDPGTRVLVVVNVQFCHHIRPKLRKHPGIRVVKLSQLSRL
jgi:hypothetical protein